MKKYFLSVSMILASSLSGVMASADSPGNNELIIEKPTVTIENGKLTPEVLEAFGRISEATPSPDGTLIAFCLTYENITENKGNSEIYLLDVRAGSVKRLTSTASSESGLQWIHNGCRLAYLVQDEVTGKPQITSIKPDGSDKQVHSSVEAGVECFLFSPDCKRVVYGSTVKPYNKNEEVFKGLDKTTGRLVDDLMYKHWDEWVTAIPHPFVAEFVDGKISNPKDIMDGEPFECPVRPFGGAESFAWNPSGTQLVYCAKKQTGIDYAFSTDSNLYLYDIETGQTVKNLTESNPGYDTNPQFSPDGKTLAWLSMATPKYESDKKRLMTMDWRSGSVTDLTENWDYWPEEYVWSRNGKEIFFCAYYEGTEPAFKIDVKKRTVTMIGAGMWDYAGISQGNDGTIYAMRHNMLRPNEICRINKTETTLEKDNAVDITSINKDIIDQLAQVRIEKRKVKATDGKDITCWEILPPDFDENKQYPSILYCQGGPQQAVSQFWSYRWNFRIMAANGYVIIAPNRRGVPGFGTEWNRQISGDYGGQNMQDYLSAADYLLSKPYIDPKGMAAIGASYGGFSVYWLAGHHENRFSALIAHAGIFNLEAQYLETEEMFFADFDLGGPYWDKTNEIAMKSMANSPHRFVDKWTSPILITVGELDYRILASQGMMAFNAAKMRGLETEMLVFPDENHWILKPQNAILWQRVFFRFLDKYCKK